MAWGFFRIVTVGPHAKFTAWDPDHLVRSSA
jgi:hypothetical protein